MHGRSDGQGPLQFDTATERPNDRREGTCGERRQAETGWGGLALHSGNLAVCWDSYAHTTSPAALF